jgi:glycosyltransferase involved in cell wall biosynthesis
MIHFEIEEMFCYIIVYNLSGRVLSTNTIGIDVRKYRDFGIGTYIQNLLEQYSLADVHGITLFAAPADAGEIAAQYGMNTAVNDSPKYSIGELISLSRQARQNHLDVLHCPHYTLPLRLPCRSVVTIHDLIHIRFPGYFSIPQRVYAKAMISHACASADRIIVDSLFTQRDVEREFPKAVGKIETIHLGVSERFSTQLSDEERDAFRITYGLTKPYILYVGSSKQHKNIGVLLKAFKRFSSAAEIDLVSAGEPLSLNAESGEFFADPVLSKRIHELGKIDDHTLVAAYQCASMVVLPSLYEGFGFSVVEAMKAGVPAIGARSASIPEVMGDAGLLFDPHSSDELAELFTRVAGDTLLRQSLIERGREHVKQFTWKRCAQQTLAAYGKALS